MLKVPMFRPHQIVLDREIGQLVRIVEWPRRLFITATGEPAYSYCLERDPDIRLQVRTQADMESGRFVAWRGQTGVLPPDRVAGGIKTWFPSESLIDRIQAAIDRVTSGYGQMRVPAESTDPDLVLADCLLVLQLLKSDALCDVIAERQRQVEVESWNAEHDDEHDPGQLAAAAAAYAINAADQLHPMSQGDGGNAVPACWPWGDEWWKPKTPRRDLVRATALALAEIEKFDRAEKRQTEANAQRSLL